MSLYFRARPNSYLGDENARLPEVFRDSTLLAKFLIAMISAKSGRMSAGRPEAGGLAWRRPVVAAACGRAPGGARRGGGAEAERIGFERIERVPGSFDRMF